MTLRSADGPKKGPLTKGKERAKVKVRKERVAVGAERARERVRIGLGPLLFLLRRSRPSKRRKLNVPSLLQAIACMENNVSISTLEYK